MARVLRNPRTTLSYVQRAIRNRLWHVRSENHLDFYGRVIDSAARRNPDGAVGTGTRSAWLAAGEKQLQYLVRHGLVPTHTLLDIGCGNLRAGRRFIELLDDGNYVGVDVSPEILIAATHTISDFQLQSKLPRLYLIRDMSFDFLPTAYFDVVQAHSVFSHTPAEVVAECLAHVRRVMRPTGFFDFTYNPSAGASFHRKHQAYFHHSAALRHLAEENGFDVEEMTDWEHVQAKMRLRPS